MSGLIYETLTVKGLTKVNRAQAKSSKIVLKILLQNVTISNFTFRLSVGKVEFT